MVTHKGEIEILKDYVSLMTTLSIGLLRYKEKTKQGQIQLKKWLFFGDT